MRLRTLITAGFLALPVAAPVAAQDQTLADVRQELTVLFVEIQRLKTQLSTTGAPQSNLGGSALLDRVDSIERELQRLTARTEQIEFRVSSVVKDGTNRVGDLEFRLCELEPGCDVGKLGDTPTLGGGALPEATGQTPGPAPAAPGGKFAVGEQGDFDRARAQFDAGEYADAADALDRFSQVYSGGPLSIEATILRGDALSQILDWNGAARAYLEGFSGAPNGPRAPEALLKLGKYLGELGQTEEACITLGEVSMRFPGGSTSAEAETARAALGCS
jgi:tol-pal system protein YbgF